MKKYFLLFLCFLFFIHSQEPRSVESKNIESKTTDSHMLHIAVSIAPLAFFVNKIAGEKISNDKNSSDKILKHRVKTHIIIPQNKNPESYEPDFASMSAVSRSAMFIGIGLPFERVWVPRIIKSSGAKIRILTLDSKLLESSSQDSNSLKSSFPQNTGQGEHLWLSLKNAKKISWLICENLKKLDPKNAEFYTQNLKLLLKELEDFESKIGEILKNMPRGDFIVYHPLFDTFASEYGLKEHSLERHGKKYGVQDVINLSEMGKKLGIKAVFTQSNSRDMQMIAKSLNARLVHINPIDMDYIANLESILREIARSYE